MDDIFRWIGGVKTAAVVDAAVDDLVTVAIAVEAAAAAAMTLARNIDIFILKL